MVHQYSKVLYFEDVRAIDIRSRKPKNYTPINLLGSTVVPGFVDAHGHITELGIASSQANIEGSKSIDEVVARLQPFYEAARLKQSRVGAGKPVWLRARGWDQNLFIDKQVCCLQAP
jgi:predicted amidohydrolase YtcJ